ncbi:hypothetical protein Scep_018606 [Stephania cephalantha]|uniref:Secreted protein n=1 Tax=Stephania cephalantha TaxID=152367 RepID=A0AAP0I9H1_9MAGN
MSCLALLTLGSSFLCLRECRSTFQRGKAPQDRRYHLRIRRSSYNLPDISDSFVLLDILVLKHWELVF